MLQLGMIRYPLYITVVYRTKTSPGPGLYIWGGGFNVVVCKTGWQGEGWYYMYKQHSIVNTGNVNALKLLTQNRYSVLNGHFVRQIHPSSLALLLICRYRPGEIKVSKMGDCNIIATNILKTPIVSSC